MEQLQLSRVIEAISKEKQIDREVVIEAIESVRWLREQGLDVGSFRTEFGSEDGPEAGSVAAPDGAD